MYSITVSFVFVFFYLSSHQTTPLQCSCYTKIYTCHKQRKKNAQLCLSLEKRLLLSPYKVLPSYRPCLYFRYSLCLSVMSEISF